MFDAYKILIIEREGTGDKGSESSPISVTFSEAVQYVYMMGYIYDNNSCVFPYFYGSSNVNSYGFVKMSNLTTSFANKFSFIASSSTTARYQYIKRSSDNKTIYWYNTYTQSVEDIFNESGCTYIFMGLY